MANDNTVSPSLGAQATGLGAAAKFNPQLWKPDELRAIFVARQGELAELVQRVQSAPPSNPPQHVLITGHRGMGKSTLLHRLALAIEDDSALQRHWAPLLFREEQYTALSLDKFWRNALDALIETLERRSSTQTEWLADIHALDTLNAQLDAVASSAEREAQALAALHDWAERHQCRLLLLVDSTEQLFEGLSHSKAQGQQALWRLRDLLSQDPVFFWVSCAYTSLEAHQAYDHPFHEFFAQLPLRALTIDDMRQAFLALARTFGAGRGLPPEQAQDHVQALLTQQPERLETLLRLAGGNPRTTVMLYQLLSAGGHDNVHTDLQRLLDDMSPLYKDRLEHQLATQQRQLVATLMEHWAPMSAKAVAQVIHMPVTQVNAQLSRLEASGWVQKVRLPGTKRFGYQVAERFFNVWYLMRLAPRRLRLRLTWLVEFMRAWFSRDELCTLARDRTHGHLQQRWQDERQLEFSRALSLSLEANAPERHQLELTLFNQTQRGRVGDIVLFDVEGEDHVFLSDADYFERFQALRPKLEKLPFDESHGFDEAGLIQGVLQSLSLSLPEKERVANNANTLSRFQCDELLKVFQDEAAEWDRIYIESKALTHLLSQVAQGRVNKDCEDAHMLVKQCQAWLSDLPSAELLMLVIAGNQRKEHAPVLPGRMAAIAPASCVGAKAQLMRGAASLLRKTQQLKEAEAFLRQALAWQTDDADTWVELANLQSEMLGKPSQAEAAYRQAIALDAESVWAYNGLGNLLQLHLNRFDEAEAAYRQAIAIDPKYANPWYGLGNLLQNHLNRFDEAEAAYHQAIAIDPKYANPWNGLGNLLQNHLNRFDEAEAAYRQAIAIDPKYANPWNGLGNLLQNHLNRFDEAEAAYRQAIAIDPKFAPPWNGLGYLLQNHLNRFDEAEAAYRQAIAIDPKYAHPWDGLGHLLQNHLNRFDEAEAAYRQAIAIDSKFSYAWNGLGNLLQDRLNRFEEAEAAYRQAIAIDSKFSYPWNGLGNLLQDHLNRFDEAEAAYRQAMALAVSDDLYPQANLARLLAERGAAEGVQMYQALLQASLCLPSFKQSESADLWMQAALMSGDSRLALHWLNALQQPLAHRPDDQLTHFNLRVQAHELHALQQGLAFAELLAQSTQQALLKPLELGLRLAQGHTECLLEQPQEVQDMAREIAASLDRWAQRRRTARGT